MSWAQDISSAHKLPIVAAHHSTTKVPVNFSEPMAIASDCIEIEVIMFSWPRPLFGMCVIPKLLDSRYGHKQAQACRAMLPIEIVQGGVVIV